MQHTRAARTASDEDGAIHHRSAARPAAAQQRPTPDFVLDNHGIAQYVIAHTHCGHVF